MKIIGMIPARGGSSRFNMKPLAQICGKPMLYWVWKHSKEVDCFEEVYVATDNEEIKAVAEGFGAKVIMTSPDCETATERLYEVSHKVEADLYVMVNGDEPLVQAADIVKCIPETIPEDGFYVSNLMTDFSNPVEVVDPTNLKIVTNKDGVCLFISRAPIPFPKGEMNYAYQKFVGVGALPTAHWSIITPRPVARWRKSRKTTPSASLKTERTATTSMPTARPFPWTHRKTVCRWSGT